MKLIPRKDKSKTNGGESRLPGVWSGFHSEMDRVFDRFLSDPWSLSGGLPDGGFAWSPQVDVVDGEKDVTVKAEIPGVDPKDLDISVSGNLLTIAGEKSEVDEEKSDKFYRSERRFGSFRRTFELPSTVDTDRVSADYGNGLLTVRIEKIAGAKPKKIPVR
jgi:HSP20 family protein